jgi:hypothetical protein|nr:MAG TPA: Head fiber protein [Caudoviricetes sp.]
MEFKITVSKRIAQTTSTESLICGNDGDTLTVTFDDEWTNISAKTARLVWIKGGEYTYIDVPFTGTSCPLPAVIQAKMLFVGFFAGDSTENTLKTSTPAQIPCISSILDVPAEAFTPDVYQNILDIIANKVDKVTGKGLSTNDYTDSAKSLLEETVPQELDRIDAKITEVEGNVYSNFKNKVDKVAGKGLSTNDYTDAEKIEVAKVSALPYATLSLEDYDTRKRGYIAADGEYTASGSWFSYYFYIDKYPIKKINAKLYSNSTAAYSIAFYSAKDSIASNLISGIKPTAAGANLISFDNVSVPENAALIVISTRFASGASSAAELFVNLNIPAAEMSNIGETSEKTGQIKRIFTDFTNANDFTFVKGELWGSGASGDTTVIKRYRITDDGLCLLGIIKTDFGHLNCFDYNPANDCLIFGNGSNDFSTEGNWFAVVKNPMGLVTSDYSANATLAANAIVYNVDIGYKVQAVWGASNLGLNNVVYLLSNDAKTVMKVLLNIDDNGELNGQFTVLDTHTSETAYPVGGAKFWGDTLYFGYSDTGYKIAKMSMSDYSVSVTKRQLYEANGTEISGTVQGLHIDDKYVWVFINAVNPIRYYLIQMYQCLGSLSGGSGGAGTTITVDAELSATSENPVQNKAVKAALDKKIDEPTGNGLVRKLMSGVYTTIGVDTTMPTSPTDNSVPTSKLVASQLNSKLDKPSSNGGVLYINSFDQPGIKGIASSAATSDTSELATVKIVKDYINSLDASEVSY